MTAGPRHRFQSRLAGGSEGSLKPMPLARLAGVAVGDLQLAELALVDGLVQSRVARAAAALGAVLDHDLVFLLRFPGDAAFGDVVAHGLLDIDVLAGLGRPDGHQRVPVVRRGDGDGVQRLVFQRLADVGHAFAGELAFDLLLQGLQFALQHLLVGIDQVGDFHVGLFQPAADVAAAAAVDAGHGDAQPVVGPEHAGCGRGAADQHAGAGSRRTLQELATSEVGHGRSLPWLVVTV